LATTTREWGYREDSRPMDDSESPRAVTPTTPPSSVRPPYPLWLPARPCTFSMDLVHAAPCTPATPAQAHLRRRGAWQAVGIGGPLAGPAATGRWPRSEATWCTSRACQLVGLLLLGVHHTCTIAVNARGTVEGICLLGGDGGLRGASAENWRRGSVATISKSAEGNLPPRIWEFSAEADLRSLELVGLGLGLGLG
jgi:hypothetical protein